MWPAPNHIAEQDKDTEWTNNAGLALVNIVLSWYKAISQSTKFSWHAVNIKCFGASWDLRPNCSNYRFKSLSCHCIAQSTTGISVTPGWLKNDYIKENILHTIITLKRIRDSVRSRVTCNISVYICKLLLKLVNKK